jgi:hypothetical protein
MFQLRFLILIFLVSTSLVGCSSFKNSFSSTGGKDQAVVNAIIDFSNTSRLYKTDSVFLVSFYDTLFQKVLLKVDERNYKWTNGNPFENLSAVSISGINGQNIYYRTDSTGIGSSENGLSRYIEIDNNLFVWHDDKTPINKETLAIFKKYGIGGYDPFRDVSRDDSKKGVHYFFCRNDLTKYKKVSTNIAIGYYDAPTIKCRD